MKTQMTRTTKTMESCKKALQAGALAGLTGLCLFAALSGIAQAGDINFNYSLHCDYPGTCNSNLGLPGTVGGIASDNVTIDFANGLVITGGNLTYNSPGATSISGLWWAPDSSFGNSGGYFTLTGMVPGLASPSTLLSGYFLAGGSGSLNQGFSSIFNSPVDVTYVDSTLLHDLGMDYAAHYGIGELSDSYVFIANGQDAYWLTSVNLDFTPSPEPSSLILLGSGILGLGSLLRRRFLG